jgi:hypothetical protein
VVERKRQPRQPMRLTRLRSSLLSKNRWNRASDWRVKCENERGQRTLSAKQRRQMRKLRDFMWCTCRWQRSTRTLRRHPNQTASPQQYHHGHLPVYHQHECRINRMFIPASISVRFCNTVLATTSLATLVPLSTNDKWRLIHFWSAPHLTAPSCP